MHFECEICAGENIIGGDYEIAVERDRGMKDFQRETEKEGEM